MDSQINLWFNCYDNEECEVLQRCLSEKPKSGDLEALENIEIRTTNCGYSTEDPKRYYTSDDFIKEDKRLSHQGVKLEISSCAFLEVRLQLLESRLLSIDVMLDSGRLNFEKYEEQLISLNKEYDRIKEILKTRQGFVEFNSGSMIEQYYFQCWKDETSFEQRIVDMRCVLDIVWTRDQKIIDFNNLNGISNRAKVKSQNPDLN